MNTEKKNIIYYCIAVILLTILLFMMSCSKVQYVPMIEHKTDSVYVEKIKYDSIQIKVKEYIGGDTIYRDSIVVRYKYRTDTIHTYSRDSIPYPVEVVKEVERKRNWYEKTMIRLGWCLIALAVAIVGWKVLKWYVKIKM